MLDDQHRNAGGDIFHQVRHALALARGEARQRFVEQQHPRLGAQGDAQID